MGASFVSDPDSSPRLSAPSWSGWLCLPSSRVAPYPGAAADLGLHTPMVLIFTSTVMQAWLALSILAAPFD